MQAERVAVVTGSSTGNGFETSLLLAKNGFYTYATMRNLDKSTRIKEIARKDSMLLEVLPLDVTDDKSVADAIEMISNRHRRIDVLVNNAGYDMHGAVEDLSIDEVKTQFETNFFGAVRLMKAVLPMMRKQRSGIIVNVSSIGGRIGVPLNSAYTGSKFALEGFSESMKYELEGFGIKVILIEPGAVKTNFLENLKQGQQAMNPDSPYAELSRKVSEGVRESFKQASSSSPVQVAEVILNAIKSENPNTRYLVGNDAAAIMERRKKSSDFEFERWMKESLLDQKGFLRS
ncbi:MAG: SDR family oxidoreductase [Candidatus Nitrosopolaris sp.]|jgi:NAD(P)-dependent dehydrogenase (short-subunit alcohol dehydrogenase family)